MKRGYTAPTRRVGLVEAGHPVPDAAGLEGSRRLVELLRGVTERDLVLCLLTVCQPMRVRGPRQSRGEAAECSRDAIPWPRGACEVVRRPSSARALLPSA
ncbi:MAG: DUF4147 domain-containing protein [Chloroflexi bacterium]|nr:DUF4147 domain-containing protein [Chloroflexota bacterium]